MARLEEGRGCSVGKGGGGVEGGKRGVGMKEGRGGGPCPLQSLPAPHVDPPEVQLMGLGARGGSILVASTTCTSC